MLGLSGLKVAVSDELSFSTGFQHVVLCGCSSIVGVGKTLCSGWCFELSTENELHVVSTRYCIVIAGYHRYQK